MSCHKSSETRKLAIYYELKDTVSQSEVARISQADEKNFHKMVEAMQRRYIFGKEIKTTSTIQSEEQTCKIHFELNQESSSLVNTIGYDQSRRKVFRC